MNAADWLRLCLLALLWGTSFAFVEVALPAVAPFAIAWGRVALAAMFFALWFSLRGRGLLFVARRWRAYLVMAFVGNAVPFSCFAWGQQFVGSGLAGVMNSTTPLFAIVLVRFADGVRRRRIVWFGVGLGFFGAAILLLPGAGGEEGDVDGAFAFAGALACLAAAVSYSFTAYWGNKWLSGNPPAENACGMLLFATLWLTPAMAIGGFLQPGATVAPQTVTLVTETLAISAVKEGITLYPAPLWGLLGVGFFGTLCAYPVYFRLLADVGAVNTMLVTFLIPVVAAATAALLLDEKLTAAFFTGAAFILLGLAAVDARIFDFVRGLVIPAKAGIHTKPGKRENSSSERK